MPRLVLAAACAFGVAGCAESRSPRSRDQEPDPLEPLVGAPSPLASIPATTVADPLCSHDVTSTDVAFDAPTELGFSAEDLLAFVEQRREERIAWLEQNDLELAPETGEHALQVQITRRGDHARLVDPMTGIVGHGLVCQSWLEIDVHVVLRSDQRALDDAFDATLYAQSPDVLFLQAFAEGDRLGGKLSVDAGGAPGRAALAGFELRLSISKYGVSGSLLARFDADSVELAVIGAAPCTMWEYAVGLDDEVEGRSGQWMLDRMGAFDTIEIAWGDNSSTKTTVSLEAIERGACVLDTRNSIDPLRGVTLRAELTLESSDGRLMGTFTGHLGTGIDPATPADLVAFGFDQGDQPRPEVITPQELGFPLQSRDGLTLLNLTLTLQLEGDEVRGGIELNGYRDNNTPAVLERGTITR